MRQITVRFAGECRKCGASLAVGMPAIYERHIGIFCPPCGPTDPEEIRQYRQDAGDRRADRYEAWAGKREQRANATLTHIREHYTGDIAFNTQPGHIPLRARIIGQEDRAFESLRKAQGFREKAQSLRHVRVAGDAERRYEAEREYVRSWIQPGMVVDSCHFGPRKVVRVNKKTATLEGIGTHDLMFLSRIESREEEICTA